MEHIRKHQQKISTVLLIVIVFLAGFVLGNQNSVSSAQNVAGAIGDVDQAFQPLFEVYDTIQSRYVDTEEVEVEQLVNGAITGMVESLGDPYSSYMDPDSFEMFQTDLSGNVEGIGVVIRTDEETGDVFVVSLIRGAAAETAGVLPGDIFVEVNGENVRGLNQNDLAGLVRGPAGSDVEITFERDGELVTLDITRVSFEVPNVEYEMLENDVAYISMADFSETSRQQLEAAVADLDVNATNGLVFDLRGNPGGLLSAAVDVASFFIEDGVVLYESFADGSERTFEANGNYGDLDVPIVVLVDEGSASASELVSGAMQDVGVAYVVGETSFGKGTVQTLQPLSNQGALRITIARYLLPSRRWIHDIGVEPDLVVPYDMFESESEEDPQLQAAIEYINDGESAE